MSADQQSDPYNLRQYFPPAAERDESFDPCCSEHLPPFLERKRIPTEFGDDLCIRKAYLCLRCGKHTLFALNEHQALHALTEDHPNGRIQSDKCIDSMAHSAGWVVTRAELRGESVCYMLCPACVRSDIVRFQRLEQLFCGK
jgi:hypothetical protein